MIRPRSPSPDRRLAEAGVRDGVRGGRRPAGVRDVGGFLVLCALGAGLAAIYLSSNFAQDFALREGPLLLGYPPTAIAAFVATGMLLMIAVMVRPELFWPLLVVTATGTGAMFVLGIPIFDEWLAACVTLGAAAAVVRGSISLRPGGLRRWWVWVFIALSVYLVGESVRGLVLYHNPKALRPMLDAVVVLSICVLLARYTFPQPPGWRITTLVAVSGTVYLALYLLHGIVFHSQVYGRSLLEGIGGAERAFAAFPLAVTIPAAILLLRFGRGWQWALALCTLVLAIVVSFLAGSRAGILATIICFAIASLRGGLKLAAQLMILAYVIPVLIFHYPPAYPLYKVEALLSGLRIQRGGEEVVLFRGTARGRNVVVPRGDTNRLILNEAAVMAMASDARLFFIGAGAYGYWPRDGRFVSKLKAEYDVPQTIVHYGSTFGHAAAEPPRPPAWPVFVGETGVIGILLILGNAWAALWHTLVRRSPSGVRISLQLTPVMVATALLMLLAWGFFAEVQTKVLLSIALMPYGLVDSWSPLEGSRPDRATQSMSQREA